MVKGSRASETTRKRMSEVKRGKHYSPRTEFKRGNKVNLGRKRSEETKRKYSQTWFKKGFTPWNRGMRLPLETRRKIGESLKGREAWNKGKRTPEDTKKKLSELARGKHYSPRTEIKRGQYAGDRNPAKRIEVRKRISDQKKNKPHFNQRGENHPNWRGGNTPESERLRKTIEYRLWREAVFIRDNWTCQKCGGRGLRLNAHHFHNFADYSALRTSLENGLTLCRRCHIEFHKIYGIKNATKEKFKEFLNMQATCREANIPPRLNL